MTTHTLRAQRAALGRRPNVAFNAREMHYSARSVVGTQIASHLRDTIQDIVRVSGCVLKLEIVAELKLHNTTITI